ncbi:hypothetical protein [Phenylobacterium sp.]|uniref:hypothetical protein n=1 Tax=Phenylobacterium sp. TaxID=1871053 RepID=UPI0035B39C5A
MKAPRRPKGAGAVMAAHAPATVEADDAKTALYRKLNYFPSPPWSFRAGGELIQRLDPGSWRAHDPACGEGHGAYGLQETFGAVWRSDIHAHAQLDGAPAWRADFLADDAAWIPSDWIITNPPFDKAAEFVARGLRVARRGVAMLCRRAWYGSAGRYELFHGDHPLGVRAPFFERVPMVLGKWDPAASTATDYDWYVWFKPEIEPAWIAAVRAAALQRGLPGHVEIGIGPGAKRRLTRADDARLFGAKSAQPLFGVLDPASPEEDPAP